MKLCTVGHCLTYSRQALRIHPGFGQKLVSSNLTYFPIADYDPCGSDLHYNSSPKSPFLSGSQVISRLSHDRAKRHSRSTVEGEVFNIFATSSTVNPPK